MTDTNGKRYNWRITAWKATRTALFVLLGAVAVTLGAGGGFAPLAQWAWWDKQIALAVAAGLAAAGVGAQNWVKNRTPPPPAP